MSEGGDDNTVLAPGTTPPPDAASNRPHVGAVATPTQRDSLVPLALTKGRAEAALAGTTLADRYDLLELVGVGGMGAVYRARDRELDEIVALKIIKRELAAMPAMVARFRHEVKLARRVTHVNVARTFEIGTTADGLMYCTMELIEGESLTQRVEQRRKLPIGEAVSIVCAVCDGLTTAHAAQVIHRDIKPDNILLASDGRVVLADFGVAAGIEGQGEISGTPAYMAPEQARGEAATPASDVYAVAVVLYELVTGRRAFGGEMMTVLSAKQTIERVMPNEGEVPSELADVIGKATARDPAQRISSAAALRTALQPWAKAGRAQTQPHRIPAMSSVDMTTIVVMAPTGEQHPEHYLAVAVHEEVLNRLGRMPRVRVVSRPGGVVEENVIGVCFDLEEAFFVRITPPRGKPAELKLPLAVEQVEECADAVSAALGAIVRERRQPPREAMDKLLRARHMIARDFTRVPDAIALLERAHELAPDEPRIVANYVITKVRSAFFRPTEKDGLVECAEVARKIVAAHPELADVQLAAGHVELAVGDPVRAARHFRAAIRNAPHLAEAHEQLGRMLLESGYIEDALARLEEAISISPSLRTARWEIARAYALQSRWSDYEALVAEMLANKVDRPLARSRYAWWRSDRAELVSLREKLSQFGAAVWPGLMEALLDVFLEGKWAERRQTALDAALAPVESNRRTAFICQLAAEAAAFSGDLDACIVVTTRAIDRGLFDLHWLEHCPSLAPVRTDPRYPVLRKLVKDRADAILDALYGDHAAVSATQMA